MDRDILEAIEKVKESVDDVESKAGWIEINTSEAIDKLDKILKVLEKIEEKL